jgi:hypothetical protein
VPHLYDIPWIVENRERNPGNTEDFLKKPGLWRIPPS